MMKLTFAKIYYWVNTERHKENPVVNLLYNFVIARNILFVKNWQNKVKIMGSCFIYTEQSIVKMTGCYKM